MRLPIIIQTLIEDLRVVARSHEPARIGMNVYSPAECSEALKYMEKLDDVCDNLEGLRHMAQISRETSRIKDGTIRRLQAELAAPRLPNMAGRKPIPVACIGCDATETHKTKARSLGWSLDQAGRAHLCPTCVRERARKIRGSA